VFKDSEYISHLVTFYASVEASFSPTQKSLTTLDVVTQKIYTNPTSELKELQEFVVSLYVAILQYSAEMRHFEEGNALGKKPTI
jgi:hypothetical protein